MQEDITKTTTNRVPFPTEDTMRKKLEAPKFGLTGDTVRYVIGTNLFNSIKEHDSNTHT